MRAREVAEPEDTEGLRARVARAEAQLDQERARAERAEAELQQLARGEPTIASLRADSSFTLVRVLLWLQTVGWGVFVLISFPIYISIAHDDPPFGRSIDPTAQGIVMALVVDVFFAPIGVGSAVAAVGLHRGRRWAWYLGVVVCAVSCTCGCVPIGIAGLVVLLRDKVRTTFL